MIKHVWIPLIVITFLISLLPNVLWMCGAFVLLFILGWIFTPKTK